MSSSVPKVAQLKSVKGWLTWLEKTNLLLGQRRCLDIVNGLNLLEDCRSDREKESWYRLEGDAYYIVRAGLSHIFMMHVIDCKSSHETMEKLKNYVKNLCFSSLIYLRRVFFRSTRSQRDSILEHVAKLKDISKQLEAGGWPVSEADLAVTLLGSVAHLPGL